MTRRLKIRKEVDRYLAGLDRPASAESVEIVVGERPATSADGGGGPVTPPPTRQERWDSDDPRSHPHAKNLEISEIPEEKPRQFVLLTGGLGTRREVPTDTRPKAQSYYPRQEFVMVGPAVDPIFQKSADAMTVEGLRGGRAAVPWWAVGESHDGPSPSRTAFNPYDYAVRRRRR